MKRITTGFATFAVIVALAIGCSTPFKGVTGRVSPEPLEVHADSVRGTARITVGPKKESGVRKDATYSGQLIIRNDADSTKESALTNAVIEGRTIADLETAGASRSFTFGVPYGAAMNRGTVLAKGMYERRGKAIQLPNYTLGACCVTTSTLIAGGSADDLAKMFGEGYNGYKTFGNSHSTNQPITAEARFQFPKDVFKIQKDQYKKDDIVAIGEFLKKKYDTKKVYIVGFASPEGPYKRNQMLSINRSREVQKWLSEQLKAEGYTQYLDSTFFEITTTSEDWDGFKTNLDQMAFSEDTKRQIIEIVSAGYEEDEKERRVMALVGGANRVEKILAPLRRATIRMEASAVTRSDDQLDAMVNDFAAGKIMVADVKATLSQEEWLYAAARTKDAEKRAKLLEGYVAAYPDDHRGHNNLGEAYVRAIRKDAAYEAFLKANGKKANDPVIVNNLTAVQLWRGNMDDAYNYAEASYKVQRTPEAAFVLGVKHHKRAQYQRAATYFDEARGVALSRYNGGLSKLLANDLAGSKNDLDAAVRDDKARALNYYVLAVVGARSGDTNLMTLNLKEAVSRDKALSAKAASDLEFRQYAASAEFKAAIATN